MDVLKHREIFNPNQVENWSIAVIGCGATGSMTALHLAKLGLKRVVMYDHDVIEAHNIPNQLIYGQADIGQPKATTLAFHINRLVPDAKFEGVPVKLEGEKLFHDAVFFCVDTMAARTQIFNEGIFLKGQCKLLVDMRMGARVGLVYTLDPDDLRQVDTYRETLYPDSSVKAEVGNCGITLSVGATACLLSSLAIWSFIDAVNKKPQAIDHRWFEMNPKGNTFGHQQLFNNE